MASTSLENRISAKDLKALQADKVNALLTESHMTYEDMAKLLQKQHQQDAPDYH